MLGTKRNTKMLSLSLLLPATLMYFVDVLRAVDALVALQTDDNTRALKDGDMTTTDQVI